jgi:hypothetical protein
MSRYHAPPVSYPVGRSVWEARWLCLLWCLAAALAVQGVAQGADPWAQPAARAALVALVLLLGGAAVGLVWHLRRRPEGELCWQEGGWHWLPAKFQGPLGEPMPVDRIERVCDFQRRLLVRLHGGAGLPPWLWLEQNADPLRWLALRHAVWAQG